MKKYFLVLSFVFSGCTTSIIKYSSSLDGKPSFYKNGLAFTEKEDGNTTYAYSISDSTNNTILALINVKNNGKKAIEVESSQYSLVLLGKNHKYKSENPEKLILELDRSIGQQKQLLETNFLQDFGTILDTGVTVLSFANLFKSETEAERLERERRDHNDRQQELNEEQRRAETKATIDRLENNKKIIQEKYLRKTTLKKGESIQGLLLFTVSNSVGKWKVQNSSLDYTNTNEPSFSIHKIEL